MNLNQIQNFIKQQASKIYTLGFKDDFNELVKSIVPIVLTTFSMFALTAVSILFCGHIGDDELDAVSMANVLIDLLGLAVIYGVTSVCETLFPQIYGSKEKKNLGIVLQRSAIILILTSMISVGLLINCKYLVQTIVDNRVTNLVDTYMIYYSPSIFFFSIYNLLSRYIQCQGVYTPILVMNLIVNILNAGFHGFFIYFLKFGVEGAAISVTISNLLLMISLMIYIYYKKLHKETWHGWSWQCLDDWYVFIRLGIPGLLMLALEWITFEIGTLLAGVLGKIDLGAQSIALQVNIIAFMIPTGISIAGNIHIGHLLGSNKPMEAKNALKVLLTISAVCICLTTILILCFSPLLPLIFTDDNTIETLSHNLILIVGVLHISDATQGVFSGVIKAIGGQMAGTVMTLMGYYLIGLPIAVCLMLKTSLKTYGFWIGTFCGSISLVIIEIIYLKRIDWVAEAAQASSINVTHETENQEIKKNTREVTDEIKKVFQMNDVIFHEKPRLNRKLLIKRLLVVLLITTIFVMSIFTRRIPLSNDTSEHFDNNSTNMTISTKVVKQINLITN